MVPTATGRLQRCEHTRTRFIEDIRKEIQPVVTEHTIHAAQAPFAQIDLGKTSLDFADLTKQRFATHLQVIVVEPAVLRGQRL